MWKRTTIAAGLLIGALGCEEPVEPGARSAASGEGYEDFDVADDEHGADVRDGIDTATVGESRPPVGRTDCVALADPTCTTEPRPEAMRDVDVAAEPGVARTDRATDAPEG